MQHLVPLTKCGVVSFVALRMLVHRECHFRLWQTRSIHGHCLKIKQLREIHIDLWSRFHVGSPDRCILSEYSQLEQEWFDNASHRHEGADWVLLQEYPNWERVTLKRAGIIL
jgi:hypothetical protein